MSSSKQTPFADGLFVHEPKTNAPDFVKGSLSIKLEEFIPWLQNQQQELQKKDHSDGWLRLDIKESRSGKWYCAVNDFVPSPEYGSTRSTPSAAGESEDDKLPF